MAKTVTNDIYKNAITSVDPFGVVTFAVDGHVFNFALGRLELQRLGRQIEAALKEDPPSSQRPPE